MKKLAIVTTHPIQYNSPWFQLLASRQKIQVKVFYTWSQSKAGAKYDPDFKKVIEWDIPLLEGYDHEFVENTAKHPGSHHFMGIDNPSLKRVIQCWHPNAILVLGWSFKSHLACMRYFKGKIPVIFRGDSTLLDETKGLKTILRRKFLTWVYKHVDRALYVGTNNKNYFRAHGLREEQLMPAWHAIDIDRFSKLDDYKEIVTKLREQLDIKPSDFVVLFAGKFEKKKDPFFLLDLAKKIKDPQIVFLLTGNGYLEEELKEKSAYDNRIKFLDFQNQTMMPAVYGLGNVFILPSRGPGETWGLAVNEAMACGLPVILSSQVGGAVDLVKNNGLVFEHNQIEKVQQYIEELKGSPELYEKASQASLSLIKQFNFLQVAEAVETACML